MKYMIAVILGLALVFSACTPAPPAQEPEAPVAPELDNVPETPELPPEEIEEVEEVTEEESAAAEVESGLDKVFGESDDERVITSDDVLCDPASKTVTFRFRNLDEKTWQLNQQLPFPPPAGIASVRITLNGYELNGRSPVLIDGKSQFRSQGQSFSDTCDSDAELETGGETTCTVKPVPLKSSTDLAMGVNELRILGPGANGVAKFTCEE